MTPTNQDDIFSRKITLELPKSPTPSSLVPATDNVVSSTPDNSETEIQRMESTFSEKELAQINALSEQIDITDTNLVLQYGGVTQKKIAKFSDTALQRVRTKDAGDVGEMLIGLIDELSGFSTEDMDFVKKSAWRIKRMIKNLQAQFSKVSTNVNTVITMLEEHQLILMQDISTLDKLYDRTLIYFKELSMYILAGKKRLQVLRETELQKLLSNAQSTSDPQAAHMYKDYADACDRFEKKLYDLELSRTVAMQMSSQIRLLQNNDAVLLEKIQTTINNTIPLWKSQMVIALGLANTANALRAQREVTNMTNSLLRQNAKNLKQATVDVARESERGIIDIETLTETNKMLIDTITEVQEIQANGREQRKSAENELQLMENELKRKLMNI